jgi:N-acetylneuraminate synthase
MKKVFIIAEAGVNHNGKMELAYKLVDAAKEAGVDAVKFQIFKSEKLISKSTKMADYQKENLKENISQLDMVKKLELSYEDFIKINEYCKEKGIMFMATPFDNDSLDFLVDTLKVDVLKIGSGDLNNYPFLEKVALKNKEIILSTGMSNLSDIESALDFISQYTDKEVKVLHCTTNYPCPMDEVNLKAMNTIKDAFQVAVGYSDHTLGIEVPIAAVALGAEIIEKHFTLDKTMEGPDHVASLEPDELKEMTRTIRNIERALGSGIKKPNKSEVKIQSIVKRKIVLAKDVEINHVLTENDLEYKRCENGIESKYYKNIIGKKVKRKIDADSPLMWEDIVQ